jgi:dihydroflavonol-4-reductase
MKALVTGASGFIGSTLIEELGTLGFDVYALMRSTSSSANLEGLRFQKLEGDLSNEESLKKALRKVPDLKYVFHLAGATSGPNRNFYFEQNARGTERLARAVSEECSHLTRFVHVSSLAAAGPSGSTRLREESEPDHPVSAYGESKLEGEREVLKYKNQFPITIIRPPMVYGPRDKGVFLIIKTVSRSLMPIMTGSSPDGSKYYSLIHSKDLARGIVQAALAKDVPSGEVVYWSGDDVVTYRQLLGTMAEKLGVDPWAFKIPKVAVFAGAIAGSVLGRVSRKTFALNLDKLNEIRPDFWICSNQKAKKALGFTPEFSLSSGMANTIDWYRRQKWL